MAVSLSLAITQNSQNIANNTSNVTVAVTIHWTNGSWNAYEQCHGSITIDGVKHDFPTKIGFNVNHTTTGSQVVMTKTVDVEHNGDGTKTLNCSAIFYVYLNTSTSASGSGSKVLTTIARASQPSLVTWPESTQNVGNFGATFSIHMNRKSDSFTHTVRYEYGNRTGTIATKVGTGTTWAVPLEFMNDIPAATSGSGRIYVDTYNGSTLVGTKYTGFTATVPTTSDCYPVPSVTLDDITGADDIYGSPVKGISKIKITVTAATAYSSPIASYKITANGATYTSSSATTGVLQKSGASRVTVTVKDKRGRTGTYSYDMNVLEYTAPTVSKLTVLRCDSNGIENDQGDYCQVTFSANVSSMSSKNTATYALRYKKSNATEWTEVLLPSLNNLYTVTDYTYIFVATGNSSFDVEVTATDRHNTSSRPTSASTAFTLLNFHSNGSSLRFGGVASGENLFQNDLKFRQTGNSYAFQASSFDGTKGYNLLAVINIKDLNANAGIVFELNKRNASYPMQVYISFKSSSETTDPDLNTITYEGENYGAFLVKSATSTWKLYVDDTTGWAIPCVQWWYTTQNQGNRISVSFVDEKIAGTDPSVLGTYYRATPAKMQSILDYIYPVGSIYLSYSHVSPAQTFGGTWTRISNTFLWAVDASGEIGLTGGAKTHTLTVNELPSHSHGSVYSGTASGTKNTAWLASGGDKMAYGALYAGGGAAHNNMPPYIQVSAWRRTA